jgi:6,7-dimethyl-8-ribityllumazine synthase
MPHEVRANLIATDTDFAIVVSRFNDLVTRRLLEAAIETLTRHGADPARITVAWVPGSWEIPVAASRFARSGRCHAVICLGAVIQGSTSHHEYVNSQTAAGIMQTMMTTGVPVAFGVLTCESLDQALERAGGKAGNKGTEAALAAIEMVNLLKQI